MKWREILKDPKLCLGVQWSVIVAAELVCWALLSLPIVYYQMKATYSGNSSLVSYVCCGQYFIETSFNFEVAKNISKKEMNFSQLI